jgi:phospho-2-dehydro-3-deoxyheptonate aldolase
MPVGFKNGTSGNIQVAVDAIRSASSPHSFLSVTKQGLASIVHTNVSLERWHLRADGKISRLKKKLPGYF